MGVTFERDPATYRHWHLDVDPPVATVTLEVDPDGGLSDDYQLKLNSYDLAVDIELADIVQRLRFEHPEVGAVVVTGGLERVFCAGANIAMLAAATHSHKVNFCKFTNETRCAMEEATARSGQVWIAAVNGTAAGGGYELAMACDEIILVDDRSSAVSLPEVPLLGVLPGTGGLTRLVDKRHVRRDLADVFATRAEGMRGTQAVDWGLVDSLAPRRQFADHVRRRAQQRAAASDRPAQGEGVALNPLRPQITPERWTYDHLEVVLEPGSATATLTVTVPAGDQPLTARDAVATGDRWWPLALARQIDDAVLRLRFNEPEVGTWVWQTRGSTADVLAADDLLAGDHWLLREVRLLWGRVLRRLDLSARTMVALVDPGSCFAGTLAELVLAADRSFMLDGAWEEGDEVEAVLQLGEANAGRYPAFSGLSRLAARFWGHEELLEAALAALGKPLAAADAAALGLVTFTPDDIDWDDEVRLALEERAAFSPDALTAMEANFRFVGPETMETKIFGRLTAWQNWVFSRPNAAGLEGALRRYGTGSRPRFDRERT